MNLLERLKYKSMEAKLAGEFGKFTSMEISADDIAKLLAVVAAGDKLAWTVKAYLKNKDLGRHLGYSLDEHERAKAELEIPK